MNRRKFFEHTGRWASGLLLGSLGGFLAFKREIAIPTGCGEDGICMQCLKNQRCGKPAAIEYRRMEDGKWEIEN